MDGRVPVTTRYGGSTPAVSDELGAGGPPLRSGFHLPGSRLLAIERGGESSLAPTAALRCASEALGVLALVLAGSGDKGRARYSSSGGFDWPGTRWHNHHLLLLLLCDLSALPASMRQSLRTCSQL